MIFLHQSVDDLNRSSCLIKISTCVHCKSAKHCRVEVAVVLGIQFNIEAGNDLKNQHRASLCPLHQIESKTDTPGP